MGPTAERLTGDAFGQLLLTQFADLRTAVGARRARCGSSVSRRSRRTSARAWPAAPRRGPGLPATGQLLDGGYGAGHHSLVMMARGLTSPASNLLAVPPSWLRTAVYPSSPDVWIAERGAVRHLVMLGNNLSLLAGPDVAGDLLGRRSVRGTWWLFSWVRRSTLYDQSRDAHPLATTISGTATEAVAVASSESGYGSTIWLPSGSTTGSSRSMNSRGSASRRRGLSPTSLVLGPATWPD